MVYKKPPLLEVQRAPCRGPVRSVGYFVLRHPPCTSKIVTLGAGGYHGNIVNHVHVIFFLQILIFLIQFLNLDFYNNIFKNLKFGISKFSAPLSLLCSRISYRLFKTIYSVCNFYIFNINHVFKVLK